MSNGVLRTLLAPGGPALPPVVVPRHQGSADTPVRSASATNRLTASPFQIDHRGEFIKEQRADADELDRRADALIAQAEVEAAAILARAHKEAAKLIHVALSNRVSADHMEANPPEE